MSRARSDILPGPQPLGLGMEEKSWESPKPVQGLVTALCRVG